MTNRHYKTIAAFFGMSAVIMGAFGAHFIKKYVDFDHLMAYKTGVEYLFFHTLLLLIISINDKESEYNFSKNMIIIGMVMFSGSIFLLSTREIHHLSVGFLGPVTPLGGLCLIAGWASLILKFIAKK